MRFDSDAMTITPFTEVAERFPVIFFDSYGVLRNHRGPIPNAIPTVEALMRAGKHVRVLTNNAARSPKAAAQMIIRLKTISPDQSIQNHPRPARFPPADGSNPTPPA